MPTETRSPEELRQRRVESAKGEASRFFEAVLTTNDPNVRRTFHGLVKSVHRVLSPDE